MFRGLTSFFWFLFGAGLLLGLLVGFVLGGAVGCSPAPAPQPPDPIPPEGACAAAESHLRELQCRDGSGTPLWQTPGGKSFTEACEYSYAQGRDWCPEHIAVIERCGDIDSAMRACK